MNLQPPEKARPDLATVEVHSIFYTIQGEGPFTGMPAVFVRLAGCNLQCPWCDTEYTKDRKVMTPFQIAMQAAELFGDRPLDHKLIVITGGEPFRQAGLGELVNALRNADLCNVVQIETNGTLAPKEEGDFPWMRCTIVCSPKTPKINPLVHAFADAFKYVGTEGSLDPVDGLPNDVLGNGQKVARPRSGLSRACVYLQPADVDSLFANEPDDEKHCYARQCAFEQNQTNMVAVVESCLKHGYRLCLQTHKIANLA